MNSSALIGLALGLALLPAAVAAEPFDVKPGLWESTMTTETSGAPPIDVSQLGQLKPEQRARIEAALKKQQAQGPRTHTHTSKQCVTQEDLSRMPFQDVERRMEKEGESCKRTVISATSKRWQERMVCTGKVAVETELSVEALSRESVKGKTSSRASGGDHAMSSTGTFSAKWLSASCEKK